jgi:hypothetical protein
VPRQLPNIINRNDMKNKREKTETELRAEQALLNRLKERVLNDLSIIIQGKIMGMPGQPYASQLTLQCIESIRNLIPKAEIIISTWAGEDVSHLDYDQIVFNEDPGAIPYTDLYPNILNNNNRQIISVINGLKVATRTYAIKMRGDTKFTDTDFTDYLREYPRGEQYRFFKQRIVIPTKYSRNVRRIAQMIHPSDIFQAGLREDLIHLWSIPLQPEPETTRAIPAEKKIFNNSLNGGYHRMRYGAEQYIWHSCCKKNGLDISLKHYSHLIADKILVSDLSIINNFVIEDAQLLGIVLPKKFLKQYDSDLYTHDEWLNLSERYTKPPTKFYEWRLIAQAYYSNVARIVWRASHRLAKFGIADFLRVFKTYLSKPQSSMQQELNYHKDRGTSIQLK